MTLFHHITSTNEPVVRVPDVGATFLKYGFKYYLLIFGIKNIYSHDMYGAGSPSMHCAFGETVGMEIRM